MLELGYVRIPTTRTCLECGRIFDLFVQDEADEWAYGHYCEDEQ